MTDAEVECPVCARHLTIDDLQQHLVDNHYLFLVILRSLYSNIPYTIYPVDQYQYQTTYEDLSELCEMMGDVAIGADIDKETTVVVTDSITREIETCPICLEYHKDDIKKINKCGHKFCGTCIDTWLASHKTCPICKIELDPA